MEKTYITKYKTVPETEILWTAVFRDRTRRGERVICSADGSYVLAETKKELMKRVRDLHWVKPVEAAKVRVTITLI